MFKELELKKDPYVVELDQRGTSILTSYLYAIMLFVYLSVKDVAFNIMLLCPLYSTSWLLGRKHQHPENVVNRLQFTEFFQ